MSFVHMCALTSSYVFILECLNVSFIVDLPASWNICTFQRLTFCHMFGFVIVCVCMCVHACLGPVCMSSP